MRTFCDTSFLCAIYRKQDNSAKALEFRRQLTGPLRVTKLLLWEFRQSTRFQSFRYNQNKNFGFPEEEAAAMINKVSQHLQTNDLIIVPSDLESVLIRAEEISRHRTVAGGHRSFDVLHVASAIELGATEFLSFDANQNRLAAGEGLRTPLAAGDA